MEVDAEAVIGQSTVNCNHVGHCDIAAAQGEREAKAGRIGPSGDTHSLTQIDHGGDAIGGEEFDGRNIV